MQSLVCQHEWGAWHCETYRLVGPYGTTDGHLRQVRECQRCGWSEVSDLDMK